MGAVLVAVVVVVLVVVAAGAFVLGRRRAGGADSLRTRFGPEYDHAVRTRGRQDAERWMRALAEKRDALEVRTLPPESVERWSREWDRVQALFAESPGEAVDEADELVTSVMEERGYPVRTDGTGTPRGDWLSIDHPAAAPELRGAERVREHGDDTVTTEALREALLHYRALVEALTGRPAAGPVDRHHHSGAVDPPDRADRPGGRHRSSPASAASPASHAPHAPHAPHEV